MVTGLKDVFEKLFLGRIRGWKKSSIVLLHLLSKFSPIEMPYKINKNINRFLYYFFDRGDERNPLKDDVYDLQKKIPNDLGQKMKEELLRYYYDNNFLDLTLTFIDGHVIAYFGEQAFQKLKHTTRGKIMKALEVFNFSDKNGRIFYFRADHDVEGMQKNIEELLIAFDRVISLKKIGILVYDRGGFSGELLAKLWGKYKISLITLAIKGEGIQEQISKIKNRKRFRKLNGVENKKYIVDKLKIKKINYRCLLILNTETNKISPFITTMEEKDLSNEELLQYYSMHWKQEQEHNAFIKLGGDMHAKALQDMEFDDTTKINQKAELKNKINRLKNETVRLDLEARRLGGKKIFLESKIKPKSKRTDKKLIRREIKDIDKRLKEIEKVVKDLSSEVDKAKNRLKRIPKDPKKKKFKYGPVDYSISIVNLANILNSMLVEIGSNGKKKFQLATLKSTIYRMSAEIREDDRFIYIEYINIRQNTDIEFVERACNYFNPKDVRLHGKIMRFSVRQEEENGKDKISLSVLP